MSLIQLGIFNPKYFIEYTDDFNREMRLEVAFKAYDGVATEVTAPPSPVSITRNLDVEGDGSPFSTHNFQVSFYTRESQDFTDLAVDDDKKAVIFIYYRSGVNWVLEYKAYVVPAEITEILSAGSSVFTFNASDMLSNLEHVKMDEFFDANETTTLEKLFDIAMRYWRLDFDLVDTSGWSCTTPQFGASIFEKLEMRTEAFFNNTEAISLKEVLETVLKASNCFVAQVEGNLCIINYNMFGSAEPNILYHIKTYTNYFTGAGTWLRGQQVARQILDVPTDLQPIQSKITARTMPPFKFVTRSYKSPARNLIYNPSFESDTLGVKATNITNWTLYRNPSSSGFTVFEIVDTKAKTDGSKSLKATGISSRSTAQVKADLQLGTTDSLLISQDLNQDNWGITNLSEVGGTSCQGTLKFSVFVEMSESDVEKLDFIRHHISPRIKKSSTVSFYNSEQGRWLTAADITNENHVVNIVSGTSSPNTWMDIELPIRFYLNSDEIHLDIYHPEFLGKKTGQSSNTRLDLDDINYYLDNFELIVAPIEKGSGGVSKDTSYLNISFKTENDDLSGELKQELLFMTTDTDDIMKKCLVGQVLETDNYNLPKFNWFYEESTTKGTESLEVQSTYQVQQLMSKSMKSYSMIAYNKSGTSVNALTTFSLQFNRYFEERNSGISGFTLNTGNGHYQIEGFTVPAITSIEDPTDPDLPSVVTITADYLNSQNVVADSCVALYDGSSSFDLTGGGIRSSLLQYAEANLPLDVPSSDGVYFYLKSGNFVREFTYNISEDKYYPTGSSPINC